MIGNQITKIITGTSGIGAIQLTEIMPGGTPDTEIIRAICQAVIAIATVITLFWKKKNKQE